MISAIIPYTQTLVTARMIKFTSTIRRIALLPLSVKSMSVTISYTLLASFFHLPVQSPTVPSDSFCGRASSLSAFHSRHTSVRSVTYFSEPNLLNRTDTRCHPVCDRKYTDPDCKIHWSLSPSSLVMIQFSLSSRIPRVIDATTKTTSNGRRKIFPSPIFSVSLCAKIHLSHAYCRHAGKHHIPCIIRSFIPEPVPLIQILFNRCFSSFRRCMCGFSASSVLHA